MTRVRRGWTTEQIGEIIKEMDVRGCKWTVICAGSNDMGKIDTRRQDTMEMGIKHQIVLPLRDMTRHIREQGSEPIVVLPPPRRDITDEVQRKVNKTIRDNAEEWGVQVFDMRDRSETNQAFKDRLRKDGVHLEHGHLRDILTRLLELVRNQQTWNTKTAGGT